LGQASGNNVGTQRQKPEAARCRRCCHCCCTCLTWWQATLFPIPLPLFFLFCTPPCLLFWLLGRRRLCKSEAQLSSAPECRTIKQLKVDKNKLQQPRELQIETGHSAEGAAEREGTNNTQSATA